MLAFAFAVFLLIITPGPGVLSLAGVGTAYGWTHGIRYLTGLWIGNNLVSLAVISGLAALVLANPVIRTILLFASAAYLIYLAARVAFAGARNRLYPYGGPGCDHGGVSTVHQPQSLRSTHHPFQWFSDLSGQSCAGDRVEAACIQYGLDSAACALAICRRQD